jgi:hypothetical protein
MLDSLARTYNSASFQRAIHWVVGAAMTGSTSQEAPAGYADARNDSTSGPRRESRLA